MYPGQELIRLAAHKASLRSDIAERRVHTAAVAARALRPLAWLDRARVLWHRLSPLARFAAIPLGFAAKRALLPRARILGSLLRWAPLAFGAVRLAKSAVKSRFESGRSSEGWD